MKKLLFVKFILVIFFLQFFCFKFVFANQIIDTDVDGLSDVDEIYKYHTDPNNADTDFDGFLDGDEIKKGYSPLQNKKLLKEVDTDGDGLNDELELKFGTDLNKKDTDNDGFLDKAEIDKGYSPITKEPLKLKKHIEVVIKNQELRYFLQGIQLGEYKVSTGKNNSTPRGEFTIGKKTQKAWSRTAKLWMPYWMPFKGQLYGLHELPEWPNGKKEGREHLGKPVSGGCIRLGEGDAKKLYDWADEGTKLVIK